MLTARGVYRWLGPLAVLAAFLLVLSPQSVDARSPFGINAGDPDDIDDIGDDDDLVLPPLMDEIAQEDAEVAPPHPEDPGGGDAQPRVAGNGDPAPGGLGLQRILWWVFGVR